MRFAMALALLSLLLVSTPSAHASDVEQAAYGRAMHAYHARDYVEAYDQLSALITAGSRNPGVYYYRGLSLTNLGRSPDAQRDFVAGAAYEASGRYSSRDINRDLARVQGRVRLDLEQLRFAARSQPRRQTTEVARPVMPEPIGVGTASSEPANSGPAATAPAAEPEQPTFSSEPAADNDSATDKSDDDDDDSAAPSTPEPATPEPADEPEPAAPATPFNPFD